MAEKYSKTEERSRQKKHPRVKRSTSSPWLWITRRCCKPVSQLYYRRKRTLNVQLHHSFSHRRKGTCYLPERKRRWCEIANFFYLKSLNKIYIEEVVSFRTVAQSRMETNFCELQSCLRWPMNANTKSKVLTHKYLETGHTHMKCDSIHATITFAKRNTSIQTPSEWDIVQRMASNGTVLSRHSSQTRHFTGTSRVWLSPIQRQTRWSIESTDWWSRQRQFWRVRKKWCVSSTRLMTPTVRLPKWFGSSKGCWQPLPAHVPSCYSG